MNYYNEFDPHAAAWLQGLIDENLIPPGHVDTRSITEISPSDLDGYTQCHFFAGIGGWPLALQLAGVPSTRPLWTGSCPCQPFSVAGEGKGIEDERHLWPVFFALIRDCNPPLVFGEQVASAAVLGSSSKPSQRGFGKAVQPVWLDGVFADLESASYACGASDIPAAGVGAPHIRQRVWWGAFRLADSLKSGLEGHAGNGDHGSQSGRFGEEPARSVAKGGEPERLADFERERLEGRRCSKRDQQREIRQAEPFHISPEENNHWGNSYFHPCRDGKYRRVPVEPGLFPLADGLSYRVARRRTVRPLLLRGAGNAIVPEVGAEFVKAFMTIV